MSSYLGNPIEKVESEFGKQLPIVIIGNGPVGIRAANLILESTPNQEVIIFGEEKSRPYNRVQLSLFLAGKVTENQLENPVSASESERVTEFLGHRVVNVDRERKSVTDDRGNIIHYSKLILALGASPLVPKIENTHLKGVHQFRTIDGTNELLRSKKECKNIYVIGSGPLGLEAAFGMKQPNNNVTLQVRSHLLGDYLNDDAQEVLIDYIAASGIKLSVQKPVKRIIGEQHIEAVELENGEIVPCDCLIFCTGISPNKQLAEKIGLETRRGIIVDQYTRTSDESIYAIGDCCEFRDRTFGVVSPGFKQAKSCVEHILGHLHEFEEDLPHVQVKFNNYTTAYYGELDVEDGEYYSYTNRLKGIYRKLILKEGRLVGVILIGNWEEESEIKIAVNENRKFRNKALLKFEETGLLINKPQEIQVKNLPDSYVVCLCSNVTIGELNAAIKSGCRTIEALGEKTKAGTVCGSCKPMLAQLLDKPVPNLVMRHQGKLFVTSVISVCLILLTILFEPLAAVDTVQIKWHIEKLWFDNFWKQVSGYTLLGLCLIATALALRKRLKNFNFGHVDTWRYVHSVVGVIALLILMIHTGVRMGENLNFTLMTVFLGATMTGALVGVFMSKNHHWSDHKLRQHRYWWSRVHYTLLWALLPLLIFHIISVYYF
ncbi:FAD-dependent oxidoreductase [Aliikangiella maris]|uniref:FAD-dependent oxidoreductase n=2 Tax=Aliikangiella maris TaxID=3162458 RepID=A0ABV2BQ43_9GAMM